MWKLLILFFLVLGELTSPVNGQTPDPLKQLELKTRFQKGVALEKEGNLAEARDIFEGIIREDANARGSLYYSGLVSLRLEDFSRAIATLNRLREIEPENHRAIVLLIQAHQALRLGDRVEKLRGELAELRKKPFVEGLSNVQSYAREKIQNPDGSYYLFLEYFDEKMPPRRVWEMKVITSGENTPRQLALLTPIAGSTTYRLVEYNLTSGTKDPFTIVRQTSEKPDYSTCRDWMLEALKN
jgi:tetratricopeptide (TPR) repeat protein